MRTVMMLVTSAFLMTSMAAFTGCESSQSAPIGHREASAGGNGEFGENPVSPGAYHSDTTIAPTTQPAR